MKSPLNPAKQKGVALFITLLVVTIATLLATEIWFNNNLDIARQANIRSAYQSEHYAKGMVLWAKDVLRLDFEEDSSFDNRTEAWNQTIAGIQVEEGLLSGKLVDLDSKFNLNNLVINNSVNEPSRQYFIRILNNLELDIAIADKLIDWMDADQIPRPQGAEDTVYLSKKPSYRSAGQAMVHISELKLIDGIDPQTFQRLKSFVTVLPVRGNVPTKINVNTIPTLLLKSLDFRISTKDALLLYNEGSAANKRLSDFFRQAVIQYYNLDQKQDIKVLLDTKSQWFQAQVNVKMGDNLFQKFALLNRVSRVATTYQWSDTAFD